MNHLHQIIQQKVAGWRTAGYPCDDYPAIAEILDYARLPDGETLRFLRRPQLRALETYWYLRLVEQTPHIFDLYRRYYPKPLDLLAALGLDREEIKDFVLNQSLEALWEHIRTDDDFVKAHKLESVRETLALDHPSYIFALAMGAGKTILIGAIVATELYSRDPWTHDRLAYVLVNQQAYPEAIPRRCRRDCTAIWVSPKSVPARRQAAQQAEDLQNRIPADRA